MYSLELFDHPTHTHSQRQWKMVCGKCWNSKAVAGGVVDGDGSNPHYRYGGLWKNLKAKKKGAGKAKGNEGEIDVLLAMDDATPVDPEVAEV